MGESGRLRIGTKDQPMPPAAPRRRLFIKYVAVILLLVGGLLVASSGLDLYFSYQEEKLRLVRTERQNAVAAATRIEQFVREIETRLRGTAPAGEAAPGRQGGLGQRGSLAEGLTQPHQLGYDRLLRDVPAIIEIRRLDTSGRETMLVRRQGAT